MDAMVVQAVNDTDRLRELRMRQAAIELERERDWLIANNYCIGTDSGCPCSRHDRKPPSPQGRLDGIR